MSETEHGISMKDYWLNQATDSAEAFGETQRWSDSDKSQFAILLDKLKNISGEATTREIGDALEDVAKFVIKNTFFYDVYQNIRTENNEIDQVVRLSAKGKQLKMMLNLSDDLLPTTEKVWLGECKNYQGKLGVTYVGKFYGLLKTTNVNFGVLFTKNGLTGDPRGYHDAYGLLKTFKVLEETKGTKEFFIIAFTMDDYEQLLDGHTFFEMIEAKKLEIKIGANYRCFLEEHEAADEIAEAVLAAQQ